MGNMVPPGAKAPETETTQISVKRLNLNLTEAAYADLEDIAQKSGRSMSEVLRLGLGLVKLALDEQRNRNRLVVADSNLRPIREVVLPLY